MTMNWQTTPTDTILYHKTFLQNPLAFSEINTQSVDATVYLASLLVCLHFWVVSGVLTLAAIIFRARR
jgi:hypothetical protein